MRRELADTDFFDLPYAQRVILGLMKLVKKSDSKVVFDNDNRSIFILNGCTSKTEKIVKSKRVPADSIEVSLH